MTEEDARFTLLQIELNAIQSAIRGFDAILFQIKGWCVTTALAIGGFAVVYHKPALLLIGIGAVVGFFIMNCQFIGIQRVFINKNNLIDSELRSGILEFLKTGGSLKITGTAIPVPGSQKLSAREVAAAWYSVFLFEARRPSTFSLYLLILVCLLTEALLLS
jgi:hypothetical protein